MSNSNVIPGFESLTKQQLFDMAAKHVLTNGRPSFDEYGGQCSYKGIGCAAAPFLTEKAREVLNGSWGSLARGGYVPDNNKKFVQQIQDCHNLNSRGSDGFVNLFKISMKDVAKQHNLNTFVLDETWRGE